MIEKPTDYDPCANASTSLVVTQTYVAPADKLSGPSDHVDKMFVITVHLRSAAGWAIHQVHRTNNVTYCTALRYVTRGCE